MKGRGNPFEKSKLMSNVVLAWGCAPAKLVNVDTKMIHSFFETLRDKYDRKTLEVAFPETFDNMVANAGDEQWDFWKSNLIQPCKIFYQDNKVFKRKGLILVHTRCKNGYNFEMDDIDQTLVG